MQRTATGLFLCLLVLSLYLVRGALGPSVDPDTGTGRPAPPVFHELSTVLALPSGTEAHIQAGTSRMTGRRFGPFRLNPAKVTELDAVVVAFQSGEAIRARVTSEHALLDPRTGGMAFEGRVEVEAGPRRIRCARLAFSGRTETFSTEGMFLYLPGDGREVYGRELSSDLELGHPTFKQVHERPPR